LISAKKACLRARHRSSQFRETCRKSAFVA
jgi:hypothetical protein